MVEPTHLQTMRKSKWLRIFPNFRGENSRKYLTTATTQMMVLYSISYTRCIYASKLQEFQKFPRMGTFPVEWTEG